MAGVWRLRFDDGAVTCFSKAITSLGLETKTFKNELVIRVVSDASMEVLTGDALEACPKLSELKPMNSESSHAGRDATANRFLKSCDIAETLETSVARRAAYLRSRARRGSAVDAVVVAHAEPGATVLTSDVRDLEALAAHAQRVRIERV